MDQYYQETYTVDMGNHTLLVILEGYDGLYNHSDNIDNILSIELQWSSKYTPLTWASGSRRKRWQEILSLAVETWMAE